MRPVIPVLLLTVLAGWCSAGSAAADPAGWRWPLDGGHRITRAFDPPDTPYGRGHRGVDLAGTPGAAVRAAGAGRIGFAGELAGRGVVTVVHDSDRKTTYEPVRATVTAGTQVTAGQVIGHLARGHPGCPVAACLHWGLLIAATYVDPLSLLTAGRVRLWPVEASRLAEESPPVEASRRPGSPSGGATNRAGAIDAAAGRWPEVTAPFGLAAAGLLGWWAIRRRGP